MRKILLVVVVSLNLVACSKDNAGPPPAVEQLPVVVESPTPTPVQSATPIPNAYQCWTDDQKVAVKFYEMVTPFGLRSYVTSENGESHVFVKPYCRPKPDLLAGFVSYVSPHYLNLHLPLQQAEGSIAGSGFICMGKLCPGKVKFTCDASMRKFVTNICNMNGQEKSDL